MTGTIVLGPVGLSYLSEVGAALSDLDPTERGELLDEVQEHLLAVSGEVELTRAGLVDRLGPPPRYAAELLAAAGLQTTAVATERVAPLWRVAARTRPVAAVWAYLRRLEPAWWAVRAYLLTGAVVPALVDLSGSDILSPNPIGAESLYLHWRPGVDAVYGSSGGVALALVILLVVVGSIGVGLRAETGSMQIRFVSRLLDLGGVIGLVTMPMWWIGPAFYAYVLA